MKTFGTRQRGAWPFQDRPLRRHDQLRSRRRQWLTRSPPNLNVQLDCGAGIIPGSKVLIHDMKKITWNVYGLLFLAVILTALRAGAGGYEGEKWALADAKRILQAARTITLTNYPDCDEATVEKRMVRVYRADG